MQHETAMCFMLHRKSKPFAFGPSAGPRIFGFSAIRAEHYHAFRFIVQHAAAEYEEM
jgi:hypothetical protein